jgi:flavin-dependent dehydrogenase
MYDLIVIGGGPAGTAAAITAARGGARVLLLERGRFPRHKVCGEFVSAESLGLLASLLAPGNSTLLQDAPRISAGRIFLDGRQLATAITPSAASIPRYDLDLALWQSAEACGAETRQQVAVQGVSGSGPFRLATSCGDFEAKMLINASGRWSNLTQAASPGRAKWLGLKAHFSESGPPPSVDLYFFPGGYCGVQPLSDAAVNACAMVRADKTSSLPEVFRLQPELWERTRGWKPLTEPVTTSPLIFRKPEAERDGALLAGDAAAFVDPFVGDGISLALRTGSLAAECVISFLGGTPWQDARTRYRREYEARFGRIFRASSQLRRVLLLPRGLRRSLLFLLKRSPALTQRLVNTTR